MARKSTVKRSRRTPSKKIVAPRERDGAVAGTGRFTPPMPGRFCWETSRRIPAFEGFGTAALRKAAKGAGTRKPRHSAAMIHAAPKKAIPDACMASLRAFESGEAEMCDAVLVAVLKHYKHIRKALRGLVSREEFAAMAPAARSVKDLGPLIAFSTLHIHPADGAGSDLGFHFECVWEEEHGLGVRVRDGRVVLVAEEQDASGLWAHAEHSIREMGDGMGG